MVLPNHTQAKDPFKVHNKPMDFNVTEFKKFIDMLSDSTLHLTYKKLVTFWYSIKKNIHNYLKRLFNTVFQSYIYVKPDFLHILEQYTVTHSLQKQI